MHLLSYFLKEPIGLLYPRILDNLNSKEHRHAIQSEDVLYKYNQLETTIFDESIIIEFYPNIAELSTMIKYSQFLFRQEYQDRVNEFESRLIKILMGHNYIIRVDDLLTDEYSQITGDGWRNNPNAFEDFSKWLENQDKDYWKKIVINNT